MVRKKNNSWSSSSTSSMQSSYHEHTQGHWNDDNDKNDDGGGIGGNRSRTNSRDIVRSYSGLFGSEGDMLGFELARNEHTDWLEKGGFLLLGTYVGGIFIFQLIVLAVLGSSITKVPLHWSWTVTNAVHCIVTIIYVHWVKGSMFDEHGELAAMTLWEQIEGRSNTLMVKRTLAIVPTLLCYAACQFSNYSYMVCFANVILWTLQMLGKLPIMNGVRIFGINQTTGIDDNFININNTDFDNIKKNDTHDGHIIARRGIRRRQRRQQQRGGGGRRSGSCNDNVAGGRGRPQKLN